MKLNLFLVFGFLLQASNAFAGPGYDYMWQKDADGKNPYCARVLRGDGLHAWEHATQSAEDNAGCEKQKEWDLAHQDHYRWDKNNDGEWICKFVMYVSGDEVAEPADDQTSSDCAHVVPVETAYIIRKDTKTGADVCYRVDRDHQGQDFAQYFHQRIDGRSADCNEVKYRDCSFFSKDHALKKITDWYLDVRPLWAK